MFLSVHHSCSVPPWPQRRQRASRNKRKSSLKPSTKESPSSILVSSLLSYLTLPFIRPFFYLAVVDSSAPYIPGQEDRWGANVHQEIHNWPDVQPPTIMITVPVSDTASGHMPTNRLSASGVVNEGFDSWGVNDEGTENPQTWDTHQSQTSTITAAPSAIASPISHPVSLSAAAALLDTQKTSSASEAARRLEAKHGMSSHHDPWPSSSNPQGPSHPVPAHRDKVPTSSAMKHPVQQQPNVWRDYKAPSSVQGRTNEGSWGQPHGSANVNWGQTKASSGEHHQQGQPQRRVVQSWETWGKTPNSVIRVMPPSPESSSEDSDEYGDEEDEWETVGHQADGGRGQPEGNFGQTAGSWGETGGGWGQGGQGSVTWGTASPAAQHKQADWGMWGAETKRLPKVTFAPSAPDGSRNILSPQQRSQILNSLLNLPQSQNTKAGQTAQHQHQQKAQNQPANNKHTTKQQSQPQWGAEDGWGTQEQSSKKKKKQQQQQPQAQSQPQWGSWGEEAGWGNPEQASDKKSKKRKDQRSVPGDENSWGAAEHGDKKSGRNQQTEGQWGSWGAENAQGTRGNKKSKLNPDHDSHNGNWGDDDWGAAGHGGKGGNKRQDDANGAWGSWGDDAGWGAIQEETEDEETEDTHHDHSTAKNVWSGNLGDNTYSMPSKTLTHAYKGTTTTLHTALPRSSLSEHANIQFLESKGVAFQPVTNAFFGTTRLARERIHWMFPSDKDERVASLLIWIQTVSYNLGAFGVCAGFSCVSFCPNLFVTSCTDFCSHESVAHSLQTPLSDCPTIRKNLSLTG